MKTRWMLGSVVAIVGLAACSGAGDGSAPVTVDTAQRLSALEVNQDGTDPHTSDATGDAPETDQDCSIGGARKRLLAEYDLNKDGRIDGDELRTLRADFGDTHVRKHKHNPLRGFRWKMLTELYDDNQDGTLDDTERANLDRDLEARCENRKQEILAKYDANQDGTLDDAEWQTFKDDVVARWQAKHAALLAQFDQNKDGKLEAAERQSAREAIHQQLEEEWATQEAQYDTNGDGHLDATERAAFVASFRLRIVLPQS